MKQNKGDQTSTWLRINRYDVQWQLNVMCVCVYFRLVGIQNIVSRYEHCHRTPLLMSPYVVILSVDQPEHTVEINAIVHQLPWTVFCGMVSVCSAKFYHDRNNNKTQTMIVCVCVFVFQLREKKYCHASFLCLTMYNQKYINKRCKRWSFVHQYIHNDLLSRKIFLSPNHRYAQNMLKLFLSLSLSLNSALQKQENKIFAMIFFYFHSNNNSNN